jgi:hypothetical protein
MIDQQLHSNASSGSSADFSVGDRCELSAIGKQRCFRYRSTMGTVVSAPHNYGWVRVQFDGTRSVRTLHKSYLVPLVTTARVTISEAEAPSLAG